LEGGDWRWIDIHHTDANKGGAVMSLKKQLGASRVVCFGDGTNDISMFEAADESYAPENAEPEVKEAATAIIGHHDEDGIATFLRERFKLED
ncbi:MAG: HAD hydrolase family protein, partial [Woeseiaceae bacterium]|nr:HAD hydrolase family protein [Woeseiaceae bacterium]